MFSVINIFKDGLAKLLAVAMALCTMAGFFHFYELYYIVLGVFFIWMLFYVREFKTGDRVSIMFLVACVFSLLFNANIPSYFRAWPRLLLYIAVVLVVGPLFVSPSVNRLRSKLLFYILDLCVLLSVASFIGYFFNINYMTRNGVLLEIGVGSFSGFMIHSIYLGLFAGLAATYALVRVLSSSTNRNRVLWFVYMLCCLGACILSASRNGVLSGIVGCLTVLFSWFRNKKSKAVTLLFVIALLGVVSFPVWGGLTNFLVEKQLGNNEMGGVIYSRETKINARIIEFKRSPIYGIGFCVIDPSLDVVNKENGQIEPGSSWLEIASMTGIIGFVLFLTIFIKALHRAWNNMNKSKSCAFLALLAAFMAHMIFEGWVLAPHSIMVVTMWLVISSTFDQIEPIYIRKSKIS